MNRTKTLPIFFNYTIVGGIIGALALGAYGAASVVEIWGVLDAITTFFIEGFEGMLLGIASGIIYAFHRIEEPKSAALAALYGGAICFIYTFNATLIAILGNPDPDHYGVVMFLVLDIPAALWFRYVLSRAYRTLKSTGPFGLNKYSRSLAPLFCLLVLFPVTVAVSVKAGRALAAQDRQWQSENP